MALSLSLLALTLLALITVPTTASASAPAPPAACTASTSTAAFSTPLPIQSNTAYDTFDTTVTVAGAGERISDVDVITDITHPAGGDIDMQIWSPEGTIVTLTTDNGGGDPDVFHGTRWDDDANPGGPAPYATTDGAFGTNAGLAEDHPFRDGETASDLAPEEPLGAFIGEHPNGEWRLRIYDDGPRDGNGMLESWGLDIQTVAGLPSPVSTSYSNDGDAPISAGGNPTVSSQITVAGADTYLTGLDVFTAITHTYTNDLQVVVTSPAGTSVTLASNPRDGGTGAGDLDDIFNGTTWDDDANPLGDMPFASNGLQGSDWPYVSGWVAWLATPTEGFAAFIGEDPNGTWTLTVADRKDGDGGNLDGWGLDLDALSTCAAPATPTDPVPTDPAPTDPAPIDPTPAGPGPSDPGAPAPGAGDAVAPAPAAASQPPAVQQQRTGLRPGSCANSGTGFSGTTAGDWLRGTIRGHAGNDRLYGDAGDDAMYGADGRDTLDGGSGDDYLSGGRGDDTLSGGAGRNRLYGRAGDDVLRAANGRRDIVNCGSGHDRAIADTGDDLVGCERVTRH